MRKATFHVFSGTGNTRHLAQAILAILRNEGYEGRMVEVSAATTAKAGEGRGGAEPRDGGDIDLFLFPVYAMAVPRIMTRYIRALGRARPLADGGRPRAAVLSTNGRISAHYRDGHEGQALAQADRLLSSLGWAVACRDTVDYPQSITSVIPAQDEERRQAILALSRPHIEAIGADLVAGLDRKRPCSPVFHLIGWPFGWLYRIFGRRALAMLFAADGRCDGCGLCAARCPASAIRMRMARPSWSYACEGCERCINLCPKKAIQTSALRVALMLALSIGLGFMPGKAWAAAAISSLIPAMAGPVFELAWIALSVVMAFGLLRLADLVLLALSFIPGLRPILAFGWTKGSRRYADPTRNETTNYE